MKKAILILSLTIGSLTSFGQYAPKDTLNAPYHIRKPQEERVYAQPIDNGDGTATYKTFLYPINTGIRGGRYILKGGKKIYLKNTTK